VFYAAGRVVMVIDGDAAPQVAEHVGAQVLALGASTSALYVVTPQALIAYSRSSGNQFARWQLPATPAIPTTAGVTVGESGTVWVWTDWATDASGYEYATVFAVPPGAAKAQVVSQVAQPGSLTTDGVHAFFLAADGNSTGARLMETTAAAGSSGAAGLVTVAAAPPMSLAAFSQSQVLLYLQPSSLYAYTPGSSGLGTIRAPIGASVSFAGTSAGLLFLTCTKTACSTVTQVDQSTGAVGPSVLVPTNGGLLLGPDPVVAGVQSGHLHLVRLT
jgi:hypothetical protein